MVFGWVFAGHQLGAASAAFGAGLTRTLSADTYLAGVLRRRRAVHRRGGTCDLDRAKAVRAGNLPRRRARLKLTTTMDITVQRLLPT